MIGFIAHTKLHQLPQITSLTLIPIVHSMVPLLEVGGKEWGNAHDNSHEHGCDWGCYFTELTSISPCGTIVIFFSNVS